MHSFFTPATKEHARYVTTFRFGKWVDRLIKFSEKLSIQHQENIKLKEINEKNDRLKSFSNIDFLVSLKLT
ncbi:hypothetical protein [Acinetobacter johnsonii]|uniref:hypothetical protein n=1 Tax=Acinetobacter johnsonii TaxID=40214 RepID=UPI00280E66D3|nr:hypothetical protein [Acinetobacter johnsonii]MDQ8975957.1 hypothetical protein [Acinetobacter johnsonii]